ncbi:hypothetical protein BJX63DRAFT_111733 [Aspergillus granulosus]|uniref:Uncharacterized protein n=1 Tax=Aspergillus granulosus TaxID=176169 RepID=A0ABR4HPU4_9EURO
MPHHHGKETPHPVASHPRPPPWISRTLQQNASLWIKWSIAAVLGIILQARNGHTRLRLAKLRIYNGLQGPCEKPCHMRIRAPLISHDPEESSDRFFMPPPSKPHIDENPMRVDLKRPFSSHRLPALWAVRGGEPGRLWNQTEIPDEEERTTRTLHKSQACGVLVLQGIVPALLFPLLFWEF